MEYFITGDPRRQFYNVLGVTPASFTDKNRNAYKKLAMEWHPDRWTKDLVLAEEAKKRFQTIQEAYEVLKSDQRKEIPYAWNIHAPWKKRIEILDELPKSSF